MRKSLQNHRLAVFQRSRDKSRAEPFLALYKRELEEQWNMPFARHPFLRSSPLTNPGLYRLNLPKPFASLPLRNWEFLPLYTGSKSTP